jgi:SAM-dependent methyltransferase
VRFLRRQLPHASYRHEPDDSIVADYAEFAGTTITEVEEHIRLHDRRVRHEWRSLRDRSFERRSELFYGVSSEYVFDILYGTRSKDVVLRKLTKFDPLIVDLLETCPGTLLDFGGGTGAFCELAADRGHEVTYLDVPGRVAEFAVWRFAKYRLPIEVQITDAENPKIVGVFDAVFSDAVLEHLPQQKQLLVIDRMCAATVAGGSLILLVDLGGPSRHNPTHHDVEIELIHERIARHGFENVSGARRFCSIWTKQPIEP